MWEELGEGEEGGRRGGGGRSGVEVCWVGLSICRCVVGWTGGSGSCVVFGSTMVDSPPLPLLPRPHVSESTALVAEEGQGSSSQSTPVVGTKRRRGRGGKLHRVWSPSGGERRPQARDCSSCLWPGGRDTSD